MAGWRLHSGGAVAVAQDGIDTDQLIPARFMATPRSEGYGQFLLHDHRFDGHGRAIPDHPLNRFPGTSVLVVKRNFGGGSSREAAVYALWDYGIRAVIGPSFGDIFAANAVNNGLLPARVSHADSSLLLAALGGQTGVATIDLEQSSIELAGLTVPFTLDPVWRTKLINGWDDIDLTTKLADAISTFRQQDRLIRPWASLSFGGKDVQS